MARGVGLGDPMQAVRGYHRRRLERLRARRADFSGGYGAGGGVEDGGDAGVLPSYNEAPPAEEARVGEQVLVRTGGGHTDQVLVATPVPDGSVEWVPVHNAGIPVTVTMYAYNVTNNTWANMPAARTPLFGAAFLPYSACRVDMARAREARIVANIAVPGWNNAKIYPMYTPSFAAAGADWYELLDETEPSALGPHIPLSPTLPGVVARYSAWTPIAAGAIDASISYVGQGVGVAVFGEGGDGVADPTFGNIYLQLR